MWIVSSFIASHFKNTIIKTMSDYLVFSQLRIFEAAWLGVLKVSEKDDIMLSALLWAP